MDSGIAQIIDFETPSAYSALFEQELARGRLFVPSAQRPPQRAELLVTLRVHGVGSATLRSVVVRLGANAHGQAGIEVALTPSESNGLADARRLYERCGPSAPIRLTEPAPRALPDFEESSTLHRDETPEPDPAAPQPSSHALSPGEVVDGRFQIERFLAAGGMGEVYQATHVYMKRRVALKLIHQTFAGDAEVAARFQREAELISRLESPHTVRVFDFGRTANSFYLAMELIEGTALDALLAREGALPPGRAVPLLLQVADAIAEAHSRSIVHRDLKPANVLVVTRPDGTDFPKVLDFGIARLVGAQGQSPASITHPGLVVGTPAYMAPEVALGQADIDARADIYSFGVMAFEVLTGRPPFAAPTLQELLGMQISHPPPNPNELRPELSAFPALCEAVLTTLAKDRSQRFQDMRALQAAMAQALREPAKQRPASAAAQPSRPLPRQRTDPIAEAAARRAGVPRPNPTSLPGGMGWAPAGFGSGIGMPPGKPRQTTLSALPPTSLPVTRAQRAQSSINEKDDSRALALAAHLESLSPQVSRSEATTVMAERLKGFAKRRGAVLAIELKKGNGAIETRDLQLEARRCQALVVSTALAHGLAVDWLDTDSAILLLDGDPPANLAQRLARAAVALHEAALAEAKPNSAPRLRMAICAGAYAMPTDAGPCAGAGVDLARRLLVSTPDDTLVIEDSLARAVGPALPTRLGGPVPGAAVLERPTSTFLSCPTAPLGRDQELKELEGLLGKDLSAARRSVLVVGGPGSGKTWLVDELAARVRKRGDRVAQVRDLRSLESPSPLAGMGELLSGLCGLAEESLAQTLPGALQSLGLPPATCAAALAMAGLSAPPSSQATTGEACHVLLAVAQAMAGARAVLFVFDDLDCAQPATHALFEQLCERLPPRFGAVATAQTATRLGKAFNVRRMPLENLSRASTADLLKALLGTAPAPDLLEFVARQSGGIPEAIDDWVRVLAQRGFLVKTPQGCAFSPPPRLLDPAGRVAARIEVFDPTARRLLEAGCQLGQSFDPVLAEQALGLGPSPQAWACLKEAALVRERGSGRFELASRRHRMVVLSRAAKPTVVETHLRIARQLLLTSPVPQEAETARRTTRHLAQGGDLAEALSVGLQAASAAIECRSLRAAALLLAECGTALEQHASRSGTATALTPAQAATQRVQHLSRGAALALAAGDLVLATTIAAPLEKEGHADGVEAASGFERLLVLSRIRLHRGDLPGSSKLLAWIPQAHPTAATHPMVLSEQAELHVASGSPALAVDLLRQAAQGAAGIAELAWWHGEVDLAARLESRLGDVLFLQGDAEGARAAYGQALVRWQAARYPLAEARVLASLGALTAQAGHLEDSARLFEGAQSCAESLGELRFQAQALLRIAQVQWQLGDLNMARSYARAADELARDICWDEGVQFAEAMLEDPTVG